MQSLQHAGIHKQRSIQVGFKGRKHPRLGQLLPRAHCPPASPEHYNVVPSTLTQNPTGIYYGSNPPQNTQYGANLQPGPQYAQQRQQQYPQHGPPTAYQSAQGPQAGYIPNNAMGYSQSPLYLSPQQSKAYSPQGPGALGSASGDPTRINPGRSHINSVRLMGTISRPERQGRCTYATILVPYATKEGIQEFLVEAWDAEATHLVALHGAQVLVDGRLGLDAGSRAVKVVANRIQLVDQSLPPSSYRSGQADGSLGDGRAAMTTLNSEQVWRMHYTTPTRTVQALSSHFRVKPAAVAKALLLHSFQTKSPLHWRVLAEEVGLGPTDVLTLADFMALVTKYQEDVAALHAEAKPGAIPPPLPTTNEGMLKVKPIREWALSKPESDLAHYAVRQYESMRGLSMLYEALRMAVVAEATQGVWDAEVDFGSG